MNTEREDRTPVLLVIRDGWGDACESPGESTAGDAVALAKTPIHDALLSDCPWGVIDAAGEAVGLPAGQMGNSEVGHLNLGAGRVVYQDITKITRAVATGEFATNPALLEAMAFLKTSGGRLHLMGLCSDGGVHSDLGHLYALVELARDQGIETVYLHSLMDGRDTSPTSGVDFLDQIQRKLKEIGVGEIATVIGRYYAMDRDNRWERVEQGYDAIVNGRGEVREDAVAAMRAYYEEGKTDEFIPPTVIQNCDEPVDKRLAEGDAMVCFNFRSDRVREITRAICDPKFAEFQRERFPKVHYVCMTEYDESFGLPVAFPRARMKGLLTHVLRDNGLTQLRIAETEKYAHVTFFFNGGEEEVSEGEDRCLIPSPQVATYDLQPEMSAPEVTSQAVERIEARLYDVIILNYANPDMVGHTGDLNATIKAVETVDTCVGKLLDAMKSVGGKTLITSDHGNAEKLLGSEGEVFTAHTSNPVDFIYVGSDGDQKAIRPGGGLSDVAPTILDLLGVSIPEEMTGTSLVVDRS
jgi:2,3-bisphosphoglycerate-independent phosphoglycerate mutase